MKRRVFLAGLMFVATVGSAMATTYAEDIVTQLTALGFTNIQSETTWLGRVKISATRSDGVREIVLNPRTGEILRDSWLPQSGGTSRTVLDDVGAGSGSSHNSGSGSESSGGESSGGDSGSDGSGSGGSGSGDSGGDDGGDSGGGHGGDDGHDDKEDDRDGKGRGKDRG